jgi:hypothetical protein
MLSVLMCLSALCFAIIRMIKLKKSGVYVGMGVGEHQAAVCGVFIEPLLWRSQTNALMPRFFMQNPYAFTMWPIDDLQGPYLIGCTFPMQLPSCDMQQNPRKPPLRDKRQEELRRAISDISFKIGSNFDDSDVEHRSVRMYCVAVWCVCYLPLIVHNTNNAIIPNLQC